MFAIVKYRTRNPKNARGGVQREKERKRNGNGAKWITTEGKKKNKKKLLETEGYFGWKKEKCCGKSGMTDNNTIFADDGRYVQLVLFWACRTRFHGAKLNEMGTAVITGAGVWLLI